MITALYIIIISIVYFIPTILALYFKREYRDVIFITNLFLGWTILGWGIALFWATNPHEEHFDNSRFK